MASVLYDLFRKAQLTGTSPVTPLAHDIKVQLIDSADYTFSQAHDFEDDLPAPIATSGNLASKTISDTAVFDAADLTGGTAFSAVTGDEFEYVIMYRDSGTPATSNLMAKFDDFTGLPFTPNGSDISLTWSASGIFRLGGS